MRLVESGEERRDLFGGRGVVWVGDLLGRRAAEPFVAVLACELEAGGSVGRHRQEQFPEIVVCLAGEGEARVDGAAAPMVPGSVVHLPLGSILELVNHSAVQPLGYLIIKARG